MKLFPWNFDDTKSYWVNPEGFEWWIDENTTSFCGRYLNNLPKLDAICFFVVENKDGKRKPITRILIDKNNNFVLAEETSLENMGAKIDWLRLANFKK